MSIKDTFNGLLGLVDDVFPPLLREKHIVRFSLESLYLRQKNMSVVKSGMFALWPNIIILIAPIETENRQHRETMFSMSSKAYFQRVFHHFQKNMSNQSYKKNMSIMKLIFLFIDLIRILICIILCVKCECVDRRNALKENS